MRHCLLRIGVILLGCHAVLFIHEPSAQGWGQSEAIQYKIAHKFYPSSTKDPLFVVISLASCCCEREQMTRLAAQLNSDFPEEPRLLVEIMDNAEIAEHVVRAGDSYSLYMSAKRGEYHLDREKGLEYLTFSRKRGRPWNEVTLNLGRSLPKHRRNSKRVKR